MIKNIGRPLWPIFICFCSFMISGCEIVDFIQEESSTKDGTIIDSCGSAESGCVAPDNATADCVNSQCVWECNEGYHINDPRNPVSCVSDETITSCTPAGIDCRDQTPSNATATCDGVSCGYECNEGFEATANGLCQRLCQSDAECPVFSFGCINGDCKAPTDSKQ